MIFLSFVFVFIALFLVAYNKTSISVQNSYTSSKASVFKYTNGTEVGRVYREDRVEVPLIRVPLHFQEAILAAEDSYFYSHRGVNPVSILRALIKNATSDSFQGGSTITQQYAKIAYLKPEQTISRKIKEIFVSLKIEATYSKSEILEKYLNAVYFGRNAYGVEMASRKYFGVKASALDPAQSIVLAALVRSPAKYDPDFMPGNFANLVNRFNGIKKNMVAKGWLTESEAKSIVFPKFRNSKVEDINFSNRGHLIAAVKTELSTLGFEEDVLTVGGYVVVTTLDQNAQKYAELAVESQRPQDAPTDLHIGLASIRPGTGEIVALYGGDDYLKRQLNDATQAIAQAGSTFKVFALIAALENGYSLSTVWDGRSPQTFRTGYGNYRVSNYGNTSFGPVSLYKATGGSINTVFVRLGIKVGAEKVVDAARRAGIPSDVQMLATPSVVLGVSSPKVIDVASAYATFAANGIYSKPYLVKKVFDGDGKLIYEAKEESKRVFSQKVMADLTYALSGVIRNGTASPALGAFPRPIAGKTGTSQDDASAWFTGYSPDLSTSVAFFRDSPKERLNGIGGLNSVTGGSFPARIWNSYMRKALAPLPISFFPKPAYVGGTRSVYVDVAKPTPKPTKPMPRPTIFKPKPVPLESKKPLPITSNKPVPGSSSKPIPNASIKPIPASSSGPVPDFSPKPIPK
ncbi:MAG: penicillin-binding protein [Actinobacteria bacterium]|nr:penicillin-binding protein [Actinomycetota bacterium]